MNNYDHQKIERKWQEKWAEDKTYATKVGNDRPKQFILDMFPYPSGEGLHVGHPRGYIATDVYSRMKRMQGANVLHPMGWDAFGLPAENFAIKNKIHPRVAVEKNVARFKEQLTIMGPDYDWSREINTSDPEFYKWTQWTFIQMWKKGLAYESNEPINWCPVDKTGLANEDVNADGTCERCGAKVEKRPLRQWVLKITDYADRLLADLDKLPKWPDGVKEAQRNWIGRSEGAELNFPLTLKRKYVILHGFTSRPDRPRFLWMRQELEKLGHEVVIPTLPDPDEPTEEGWVSAALAATDYDENTIVCGFSLGAVTAIKVAEKLSQPIAGIVLAGGFVDRNFKDKPRNFDQKFKWEFDAERIRANAGFITQLHDVNDTAISEGQAARLAQTLGIKTTFVVSEKPHFGGDTEPTVMEALLPQVKVFTTRPDTLFGATFLVLAPEHDLVQKLKGKIENWDDVGRYIDQVKQKTDIERRDLKEKTGVELRGVKAINPGSGEEIPIWIADYVLLGYGAGAIMAVPAHDERDFEFAKKYSLPIRRVVEPAVFETFQNAESIATGVQGTFTIKSDCWPGDGRLINSGEFNGFESEKARRMITEKMGKSRVTYRIKDWVFSRQRYWGEPIPMIHCGKCGVVAVPEKDLPVLLPEVENYEPTDTGESPLANIAEWVNVACPSCTGPAKRETNTMPQWAGSSWYYLRYIDPENGSAPIDPKKEKEWMPVDVYVGGDHATRHLIYARFWHKFLFDSGVVSTEEPFPRLEFLGFILAEDGRKMSKRWGNIINPDEMIERFGADAFRLYEMFIGPFENTVPWNTDGLVGTRRFVEKVLRLKDKVGETSSSHIDTLLHKTIKKVEEDIEAFKFNTAVSSLMILGNALEGESAISREVYLNFLRIIAPFAPHISEELWHDLGEEGSIHLSPWPQVDIQYLQEVEKKLVVQVNGKMRGVILVPAEAKEDEVIAVATKDPALGKWITEAPKRVVYVPGKIINLIL